MRERERKRERFIFRQNGPRVCHLDKRKQRGVTKECTIHCIQFLIFVGDLYPSMPSNRDVK